MKKKSNNQTPLQVKGLESNGKFKSPMLPFTFEEVACPLRQKRQRLLDRFDRYIDSFVLSNDMLSIISDELVVLERNIDSRFNI